MSPTQLNEKANRKVLEKMAELMTQGHTQKTLADALGYTQPFISLLLRGKARASFAFAERLASLSGTTMSALLDVPPEDAPPSSAHRQPTPKVTPLDAVRAMGEASNFDLAWVRAWKPGGSDPDGYSPDLCWSMMQADYARAVPRMKSGNDPAKNIVPQLDELASHLSDLVTLHRQLSGALTASSDPSSGSKRKKRVR